ncbi:hypothetical protein HanXRQr2_Chr17g0815231 [Helianthus annuus]|uniref:Uncharacterized protein n=1 Tax=Helianthus annuus TaxID=4232 RepID=A0A9K3DKT5_HELAN|nr:hypothetical protein HanXRQr2_Chr17g0815231 [Helianthus annuus]KAJ0814209.1 hypothetical protein HanPSC8_Chr17g0782911 [Helianthus annuus]
MFSNTNFQKIENTRIDCIYLQTLGGVQPVKFKKMGVHLATPFHYFPHKS